MRTSLITPSKISKSIGYFLDNFFPPIIRDSRWFYGTIIKIWNKKMDIDFKRKAFFLSDAEFAQAYEDLVPMRSTDNTKNTIKFVLEALKGSKILEVGCGNGDIAILCAQEGKLITATDIAQGNIELVARKANELNLDINTKQINVESIDYEDKSFETTICLHTLEHVRYLHDAIAELKRVTSKRIIVIVPKQKFHKYTADYHLNFFYGPEQLQLLFGLKKSNCFEIDHCLCYIGDID